MIMGINCESLKTLDYVRPVDVFKIYTKYIIMNLLLKYL